MSSSLTRPLTSKTRRRHRFRRGGVLTAVFIATSLCAAACGGGSGANQPASQGGSNAAAQAVTYADCMRAHGVTNYPEPGSAQTGTSIAGTGTMNPASPTFRAAQAKCAKLSPLPPIKTHATEKQIRQALETARCMRHHGVPDFPDPIVTSTQPAPTVGYTQEYGNGILFKVPLSIVNSSAFDAAAKACNVAQQFDVSGV
jgi:hypothetical protein